MSFFEDIQTGDTKDRSGFGVNRDKMVGLAELCDHLSIHDRGPRGQHRVRGRASAMSHLDTILVRKRPATGSP